MQHVVILDNLYRVAVVQISDRVTNSNYFVTCRLACASTMQTKQKGGYFPMFPDTNPYQPSLKELPPSTMSMHVPLVLGVSHAHCAQRHDQILDNQFGQMTKKVLTLVCEMASHVASYKPKCIGRMPRVRAAETVILNSAGQKIGYILSVFINIFNEAVEDGDMDEKKPGYQAAKLSRTNHRDPAHFLESEWSRVCLVCCTLLC
jgi:hypothetical protein